MSNSKDDLVIAMACTHEWYHYLMVDVYSLLSCTKKVKKIYLLLETDNIDDVPNLGKIINKFKVDIEVINLNNHLDNYLNINSPNRGTVYSDFSFGRLLLAELTNEDKILYIDTDAIVRKDISNLCKYDICDYYLAGVKDYGIMVDNILEQYDIDGKYVNSGFVLFNLKKIREENIVKKWFELINNEKLTYPDQDAMNIVCQYNEKYISSMYNSCEYFGDRVTMEIINRSLIKVYHYAGPKIHWVVDRFYGEEWCDAEEQYLNEFE